MAVYLIFKIITNSDTKMYMNFLSATVHSIPHQINITPVLTANMVAFLKEVHDMKCTT